QGRFARLLTATKAERDLVLRNIFRVDELQQVRERARTLLEDLRPKLDHLRGLRTGYLDDPEASERRAAERMAAAEERERELAAAEEERADRERDRRATEDAEAEALLASRAAREAEAGHRSRRDAVRDSVRSAQEARNQVRQAGDRLDQESSALPDLERRAQ